MIYEKPEMFIVTLDEDDIIRTSDTLENIGGAGGNESGSTVPFNPTVNPIN